MYFGILVRLGVGKVFGRDLSTDGRGDAVGRQPWRRWVRRIFERRFRPIGARSLRPVSLVHSSEVSCSSSLEASFQHSSGQTSLRLSVKFVGPHVRDFPKLKILPNVVEIETCVEITIRSDISTDPRRTHGGHTTAPSTAPSTDSVKIHNKQLRTLENL